MSTITSTSTILTLPGETPDTIEVQVDEHANTITLLRHRPATRVEMVIHHDVPGGAGEGAESILSFARLQGYLTDQAAEAAYAAALATGDRVRAGYASRRWTTVRAELEHVRNYAVYPNV